MDKSVQRFSGRVKSIELAHKQTDLRRRILSGASGFIESLEREALTLTPLRSELERLRAAGAGYDRQLAQIVEEQRRIEVLKQRAAAVLDQVSGSQALSMSPEQLERIWTDSIFPLVAAEHERRS